MALSLFEIGEMFFKFFGDKINKNDEEIMKEKRLLKKIVTKGYLKVYFLPR
jgi:hypothetical protein